MVGTTVGEGEGCLVAMAVGLTEGCCVGLGVGLAVGTLEGLVEGCRVGCVGTAVGKYVGLKIAHISLHAIITSSAILIQCKVSISFDKANIKETAITVRRKKGSLRTIACLIFDDSQEWFGLVIAIIALKIHRCSASFVVRTASRIAWVKYSGE